MFGLHPCQMSDVWLLRLHSFAAKQKVVDTKELRIKDGRCLVFDLANTEVKRKLYWVPYNVPQYQVHRELESFGKGSDISRDHIRQKGLERVESKRQLVQMTLKERTAVHNIPHKLRVEGCEVRVVVPERPPLSLRCRKTGYISHECRVPRCTECHGYSHGGEDCVMTYPAIAREC